MKSYTKTETPVYVQKLAEHMKTDKAFNMHYFHMDGGAGFERFWSLLDFLNWMNVNEGKLLIRYMTA